MATRKKAAAKKKAVARKKAATRKKAAAKPTSAVVPAQEAAVAAPSDMAAMMEAAAGAGTEEVTQADMQIPLLRILQSNSPQVERGERQAEGAEEGMGLNTLSGEMYPAETEAISVVRAHFNMKVFEWVPRSAGGGLVSIHDDRNIANGLPKNERGVPVNEAGNEMVLTGQIYALVWSPEAEDWQELLIPMASSNLRCVRSWNSLCTMFKPEGWSHSAPPPTWARVYNLFTEFTENPKGSYYRWSVEPGDMVEDVELFRRAQSFHDAVSQGSVAARYGDLDDATTTTTEAPEEPWEDDTPPPADQDDIPF